MVWFGEIERKIVKLSKTTILTVLPLNYFMARSILEDERGGKIKIGYCVDNSDVQLCLTEIFINAA